MTKDRKFPLKVGNSYQRISRSGNREIALVRAMSKDSLGLPHVHYSLKVLTPSGANIASDKRVLSLKVFEKTFS